MSEIVAWSLVGYLCLIIFFAVCIGAVNFEKIEDFLENIDRL